MPVRLQKLLLPIFSSVILIWPTYDNSLFINRRYISESRKILNCEGNRSEYALPQEAYGVSERVLFVANQVEAFNPIEKNIAK